MTALPDKTSMLKAWQSHRSPTNFTMAYSHYQQAPMGQDKGVVDVGWSGCCQRSFLQQDVDSQAADMSPSPVVFLRQVSAGISSRTSSCSQDIRDLPTSSKTLIFQSYQASLCWTELKPKQCCSHSTSQFRLILGEHCYHIKTCTTQLVICPPALFKPSGSLGRHSLGEQSISASPSPQTLNNHLCSSPFPCNTSGQSNLTKPDWGLFILLEAVPVYPFQGD